MPKVRRGRISGLNGMDALTASELFVLADQLRAQAADPANTDDTKWLLRRADRIAALARGKAKSVEHKELGARHGNP